MGFLDNVKEALKGAVSPRASKDAATPTPTPAEVPVEQVAPVEAVEKFETYTVKSGDTLSEICARNGVSRQEIIRLNSIDNPDLIFPGQVFRIPKKN